MSEIGPDDVTTDGVIVHEWYESHGGAEAVVDRLRGLLPGAELHCLWVDGERIDPTSVRESWLARTPLRRRKALALPMMPIAWRNVGAHHRWAIISTHLFAHHYSERANRDLKKLAYVHTPARYIWAPEVDPRGANLAARIASPLLRPIDRQRAGELDSIAANSEFVRQRIMRAWERDSRVIYPPVAAAEISRRVMQVEDPVAWGVPRWTSEPFLLAASRLVTYKRIDAAIAAASAAGLPLVVAGSGPDRPRLEAIAADSAVPVYFAGRVSDDLLHSLYSRAAAFVFPAVEDFGIMPVEALASGTPIVVNAIGGAAEILGSSRVGSTFDVASASDAVEAIQKAIGSSPDECRRRSLEFDVSNFDRSIHAWLSDSDIS